MAEALSTASLARRVCHHVIDLARLAVPVIVVRAGVIAMPFVDTIIVGHAGTGQLAAYGLGASISDLLTVILLSLSLGTSFVAACSFGAGDALQAAAVWRRSVPFALVGGTLFASLTLPAQSLFLALGQPEALAHTGGWVAVLIGSSLPAVVLAATSVFFLEAIGRPLPAMTAVVTANLLNILLNWLLVYGFGPVPALGAIGSVISTLTVR